MEIPNDKWYTLTDLEDKDWLFGGLSRHQLNQFIRSGDLKVHNIGVSRPVLRVKGEDLKKFIEKVQAKKLK